MKKLIHLLITFPLIGLFSGCKNLCVDSQGAVPSEAAAEIAPYRGTYGGVLVLQDTLNLPQVVTSNFKIRFELRGDRPVLTPEQDILGEGCHSKIGRLLRLTTSGAWDLIATFAFDPGLCPERASGRVVMVYANTDQALLSLAKDLIPTHRPHGLLTVPREYRAWLKRESVGSTSKLSFQSIRPF